MLSPESQAKIKKYVSFLRHQMLEDGASFESVFSMCDDSILETFRKCCGCGDELFSKAAELQAILEWDIPEKTFDILYESIEHHGDDIEDGDSFDEDIDIEDDCEYALMHEALVEDDEDIDIIRGKGIMDGASTLDEAIAMVQAFADMLELLQSEGYELTEDIIDDHGILIKEKDHEQKE